MSILDGPRPLHWKDSDCPNCGGRSFSPVDPGDYYGCEVCQAPYATAESQRYYRDRSDACRSAFDRWAQTEEGGRRVL